MARLHKKYVNNSDEDVEEPWKNNTSSNELCSQILILLWFPPLSSPFLFFLPLTGYEAAVSLVIIPLTLVFKSNHPFI